MKTQVTQSQVERYFVEFENHFHIYVHASSPEEVQKIIEPTDDTKDLRGTSPILLIETTG